MASRTWIGFFFWATVTIICSVAWHVHLMSARHGELEIQTRLYQSYSHAGLHPIIALGNSVMASAALTAGKGNRGANRWKRDDSSNLSAIDEAKSQLPSTIREAKNARSVVGVTAWFLLMLSLGSIICCAVLLSKKLISSAKTQITANEIVTLLSLTGIILSIVWMSVYWSDRAYQNRLEKDNEAAIQIVTYYQAVYDVLIELGNMLYKYDQVRHTKDEFGRLAQVERMRLQTLDLGSKLRNLPRVESDVLSFDSRELIHPAVNLIEEILAFLAVASTPVPYFTEDVGGNGAAAQAKALARFERVLDRLLDYLNELESRKNVRLHSFTLEKFAANTRTQYETMKKASDASYSPFLLFGYYVYESVNQINLSKISGEKLFEILEQEQIVNGYAVRIYGYKYENEPTDEEQKLEILKDGKEIYSADGYRFRIGLIDMMENTPEDKFVKLGNDITGDGMPDLVVSYWSGGAHCCFEYYVFSFGDEFKLLEKIEVDDSGNGKFVDVDGDGILEFIANDFAFAYWNASFAGSPAPQVILKFRDGKYRLALDLMKQPLPQPTEIDKWVHEIRNQNQQERDHDAWIKKRGFLPSEAWGRMLDLIYTGHPHEAWRFLDRVWQGDETTKAEFIADFKKQLSGSRYWNDLQALLN